MTVSEDAPLILLVDDFEDALDIYGTYLRTHGYRVGVARDGAEAVSEARRLLPSLILLDLRMPVLDGTAALHALRQDARFREIPVVALTAHALDDERQRALTAGFDLVVSKPCLPDELLVIVRRLAGPSREPEILS